MRKYVALAASVALLNLLPISGAAATATISDNSTISAVGTLAPTQGCGGSRTAISASTRIRNWSNGDEIDFSYLSTASFVWGSAENTEWAAVASRNTANQYDMTAFTPVSGATYTLYTLKEGSTSGNYFCRPGRVDFVVNGTDTITGWVVSITSFFTSGDSQAAGSGSIAAAAEAAIAKATAIAKAQRTLVETVKANKPATLSDMASSNFAISQQATVDRINKTLLALQAKNPGVELAISEIKDVVAKESIVERISTSISQGSVQTNQLVNAGLIDATNTVKTSVVNALKSMDPTSLNSVDKLKAAIAAQTKIAQDRYARTKAIVAKVAAGK
jgi:hypothetical protein